MTTQDNEALRRAAEAKVRTWVEWPYTSEDHVAVGSQLVTFTAGDLKLLLSELDAARDEATAISGAIGTVEFMDPPDGGDVSLAEQVRRMKAALDAARGEIERKDEALRPFADVGQWLFARDLPDETPVVGIESLNGLRGALTRGNFKAAFTALNPKDPS